MTCTDLLRGAVFSTVHAKQRPLLPGQERGKAGIANIKSHSDQTGTSTKIHSSSLISVSHTDAQINEQP